MKFRQCFNKFTGEVDHTLANCPTDDSKHETKISGNPASYEYSQDLKLCPDMSLPSCTVRSEMKHENAERLKMSQNDHVSAK